MCIYRYKYNNTISPKYFYGGREYKTQKPENLDLFLKFIIYIKKKNIGFLFK